MSSTSRNGGQMIVDSLVAHGADRVFCVPGESHLEVLDALYDVAADIDIVTCRHEHGAANMAEAHAKLTGRPGICLVTRGPGACNASIGVHTAFQDSTPMILLVGQVSRPHLGREAFQEVDYRQMFAPLAKGVDEIDEAGQVPAIMASSFQTALSGRPGPVVISMPEDMLGEVSDAAPVPPREVRRAVPAPEDMERLRDLLAQAQRPVMMIGGGGWDDEARAGISAFADAAGLPTCCSFRRHHLMDNASANFVGEIGVIPNPSLLARIKESDLFIVVGARLGEMTTQGYTLIDAPDPKQKLVHVHADAGELGHVFRPELAIHSGMVQFTRAVAAMGVNGDRWRDWAADARRDFERDTQPGSYAGDLDMGRVMEVLNDRLGTDAIVTVDGGNFCTWPQRFLDFGGGRLLLGPTSGAMGYAVPAAVAASITFPKRTAVAILGDGAFGMTGQELSTAVLYGARPLIIVGNNRMYGTIRMHQERHHSGRVVGTDLGELDFAALARAYGAHGERVAKTDDFEPAFDRAMASGKAALIELEVDPDLINTRTTLSAIRKSAARVTE